jgi:hypothetical protein
MLQCSQNTSCTDSSIKQYLCGICLGNLDTKYVVTLKVLPANAEKLRLDLVEAKCDAKYQIKYLLTITLSCAFRIAK